MNQSLRSVVTAAGVALLVSACGGGGGGSSAAPPPVGTTPPPVVTPPAPVMLHAEPVAGQPNTPPRYANGTQATAGLLAPTQLALDKDGNLYVSDADFVVHKMAPSGQVSLLAGTAGQTGAADGTGAAASLMPVTAMATDSSGNVFVASDHTIRKITAAGGVTTFAGSTQMGIVDGQGTQAAFYLIRGMAFDAAGNLYVADNALRRVSPSGTVVTVQLENYPSNLRAVALDPKGGITVTDGHKLLRYDAAGKLQQTVDMTDNTDVSSPDQPHYNEVSAIAYTPDGLLYAVDTVDYASTSDAIRVVDAAGKVTTLHSRLLPAGLVNGPVASAHFGSSPTGGNGLAVDKSGNLFLADPGNHAIRKISADRQVSTFAGGWTPPPAFADGSGAAAAFHHIGGFATDKAGNYYVADRANCAIRKITADHVVTTLAGVGGQCGETDGAGAAARFQNMQGMAQAPDGSLYVIETTTVRKVALDGVVTTLAGTAGTFTKQDGSGKAASFQNLNSIAVGVDGNLLVSDGNQVPSACNFDLDNTPTSLRTITPQGLVSTLAGTEWRCDQRDIAPAVWAASDLSFDGAGNLYLVSGGYLGKRAADGTASYLLDSKGAKIAASEVVVDDGGNVFFTVYGGAVYKYGADRVVTEVLAPTNAGAAVEITPDVAVAKVTALTYVGNHRFVASFDDQVVVVTLK